MTTRKIIISTEKGIKSQTVKSQVKRFLMLGGRIANVKFELTFKPVNPAYVQTLFQRIKNEAVNEVKIEATKPRIYFINNR